MLPIFAYGHDYGNAETAGVVIDLATGAQRALSMSSATALGSLKDLANKLSGFGKTVTGNPADCLASDEHVLEFRDEELFLGNLALKQSRSPETGRDDIGRYESVRSLQMLLATSGLLTHHREYQLQVVTGLPVASFGNTELRKRVRANLEGVTGEHVFKLDGVERLAKIKGTKIIMEGAGALIAYGTPNTTALQGVIDIGGRTTDLFVAEGQRPIIDHCAGKPLGVERAADLVSERFEQAYSRPLKLAERRAIFHAHVNQRTYPDIIAQGQSVNTFELRDWVETALKTVGNEIVSFVASKWHSSESGEVAGDISPIALVGGGAYYFAPALRNRIHHLTIPHKPELANAVGYAALAYQLTQQLRPVSVA